jgi:hypothetical protein
MGDLVDGYPDYGMSSYQAGDNSVIPFFVKDDEMYYAVAPLIGMRAGPFWGRFKA